MWYFTSSVFMTVGDADTHPGMFSSFESHVVRQRIHGQASVLEVFVPTVPSCTAVTWSVPQDTRWGIVMYAGDTVADDGL